MLDSTKRGVDNDVGWWQDRLDARSRSQVAAIAVARGILLPQDLAYDGSETMLALFLTRHGDDARERRANETWRSLYRRLTNE